MRGGQYWLKVLARLDCFYFMEKSCVFLRLNLRRDGIDEQIDTIYIHSTPTEHAFRGQAKKERKLFAFASPAWARDHATVSSYNSKIIVQSHECACKQRGSMRCRMNSTESVNE